MGRILVKTYGSLEKHETQEIKVDKFPLVIFTDSHTNTNNIDRLINKYPKCQLISLGDITYFPSKLEPFNKYSIEYFINHKIPTIFGNHDYFIASEFINDADWFLEHYHVSFLKSLPLGFKLVLPNNKHYLCYHCSPYDIWGHIDKGLTKENFLKLFPIEDNTLGVIIGHHHYHFTVDFPGLSCKLEGVGRLSKVGEYALLTENGIEKKML